ncbi:MAG: 50S ribosomal protein L29 [bacterium]
MKFKELKQKNETELKKLLADSREKLRDLRFRVASRQLKDVRQIRKIKKTIAKVLTLLTNKK